MKPLRFWSPSRAEPTAARSAFPRSPCLVLLAVFLAANLPALAADSGSTYTVIDLGTLGGSSSRANGINRKGQVVGSADLSGNTLSHAFLYFDGVMTDLSKDLYSMSGVASGVASGINNGGQVVGTTMFMAAMPSGFLIPSPGFLWDSLGGSQSAANAINNLGQVVGAAMLDWNQYGHAFLYSGGAMSDLGTLAGSLPGISSAAYGINDLGQVVGMSELTNRSPHAFLYSGGKRSDLGTLGGSTSLAYAINNQGQIVGVASLTNSRQHAFLYSGAAMADLGTLGGSNSCAYALNNLGQVVGSSLTTDGSTNAFLYSGDVMTNLNRLANPNSGWTLIEAKGINDAGQIIGYGLNATRQSHALLLNPPPEPPGIVTNASEASLRGALKTSTNILLALDDVISLSQTITITNDTVLDGSGHSVVISGQNLVRVFTVSSNAHFTLIHVTVANGWSDQGGGLYNEGGTVTALNCIFTSNHSVGLSGTNGLDAYSSTPPSGPPVLFPSTPGGAGSMASGGAILNRGACFATNCLFSSNRVLGGGGGSGGAGGWFMQLPVEAYGGAPGGSGGFGAGGGVYNLGTFVAANSTFCSNTVSGGLGGRGGRRTASGAGGPASDAAGGGLWNGNQALLVNCTFFGNQANGGGGGTGGDGGYYEVVSSHPPMQSANGGSGGRGYGGAIYNNRGNFQVLSCTLSANDAFGGAGGAGGGGALAGQPGAEGRGFGGNLDNADGSVALELTILANSVSGGDMAGSVTDKGNNLCSDATGQWTTTTSLRNTDPKLGPLADNGGPTPTMLLLPGSPALDVGNPPEAPATDQRGVARPVGTADDIGALEGSVALPGVDLSILPSILVTNSTTTLALTLVNPNVGLPLESVHCLLHLPAVLNLIGSPYGFSPAGGVQVVPLQGQSNITTIAVSNLTLSPSQAWTVKVDVASAVLGRATAVAVAGAGVTGSSTAVSSATLTVAGPPTVGFEFGQSPSSNTATWNAAVTPNGLDTTAWFVYGPTTNYASQTPPQGLGSGLHPVFLTTGLSNLGPDATYHFCVVATNSNGSVRGEDQTLSPPRLITRADETSLRAALSLGGSVKLACDGTLILTNPLVITRDTILDASGHDLTLSGNQLTRVLQVNPGLTLSLIHLTIADGRQDKGAGLFNDGGVVNILECTFANNQAVGTNGANGDSYPQTPTDGRPGGPACGGGIYNRGTLTAKNARFSNNSAVGGKGGIGGNSSPISPAQDPGVGGAGGSAYGGGIYQESGRLILESCVCLNNQVTGGDANLKGTASREGIWKVGPTGGEAQGGWVYLQQGQLQVDFCTAAQNSAVGGTGGESAVGYGSNPSGGQGGAGGNAGGGAVCNLGRATVNWTSFASNQVRGGSGGPGSQNPGPEVMGQGSNPTLGAGGAGGRAQGAAILNQGTLAMNQDSFVANQAQGGAGGLGAKGRYVATSTTAYGLPASGGEGGAAGGGGVSNENESVEVNGGAFANGSALGGLGGPGGVSGNGGPETGASGPAGASGGGSIGNSQGYVILWNSVVTASPLGPSASGLITDGGHNLSGDASCGFTTLTSSNRAEDTTVELALHNLQLQVAYGEMRLLPPQRLANGQFQMTLLANPNQTYVIQVSTNLSSWLDWTNITASSSNTPITDPDAARFNQRFYRALKR